MQYECVILKELRSVLSSNTVHLLAQQYTEIIVSPVFGCAETGASDVTTQTKVCLQSADSSRRFALSVCLSVLCACFVSCAQRRAGKLGAYSLCSSSMKMMKVKSWKPLPHVITPTFYHPPSHFHYCFYLILQPISPPPPRPPPLQPLQTTSCLCWSIDPHSCVSVASLWARLCEIGLLISWRWVAEM